MTALHRRSIGIVLVCLLAATSMLALQPQTRSVSDAVYTDQQAVRGQATYKAKCSSCHGDKLEGRVGPPLAGDDFLANWNTQPLLELANKIRKTMPKDETTAKPTSQETADVLAYMLQTGKFPSGRTEFPADDTALAKLSFPAAAAAAPKPALAAQQPSRPPTGNLAQVMRGILFPSANIVFTTQSIDPGVKRTPPKDDSPTGGFDWLTWGGGVYTGWDVVDYASVSLAESSSLMLTPGRRCENGKLVPVTDADWIKFTRELEDAGKASYKASQTRSQDAVSDSTNQLNDACLHCHNVYRGRTHCESSARR